MGRLTVTVSGGSVGGVARFRTESPVETVYLKADLAIIQSGNGTPATDNVRPISGRTGLTVYRSGVNPDNPETLTADWESAAGTVYRGTVDLVSGTLTVDTKMVTLDNTASWSVVSSTKFYCAIGGTELMNSTYAGEQVCNMYPFASIITGGSAYVTEDKHFYIQRNTQEIAWNRAWVYDTSINGLTAFKAMLAQTPLQITHPITPQTYQLTPQTIMTLQGINRVWADDAVVETEFPLVETQEITAIKRRIMENQPRVETVSGNPAVFRTDITAIMKSVSVSFVPRFTESWTPSLDRPNPITGYSQLQINVNETEYTSALPEIVSGVFYGANAELAGTSSYWPIIATHWGYITTDSTESRIGTIETLGSYTRFWYYIASVIRKPGTVPMCDSIPSAAAEGYAEYNQQTLKIGASDSYNRSAWIIMPTSLVGTTAESINAYLLAHPITFAYEMQTPVEYQIRPTYPIKARRGINTVTTNANNGMQIKYLTRG